MLLFLLLLLLPWENPGLIRRIGPTNPCTLDIIHSAFRNQRIVLGNWQLATGNWQPPEWDWDAIRKSWHSVLLGGPGLSVPDLRTALLVISFSLAVQSRATEQIPGIYI